MTKITILGAAFLASVGAFGCSSSSSPATSPVDASGASNTDSSGQMVGTDTDASNPLGPPAAGKCPGVPCATGESCCYNPLSMTGLCQSASTMCGGAMITLGCSAPADCDKTPGTGCCLRGTFSGGAPKIMAACGDPVACTAVASTRAMFTVLFCDSMHACPSGLSCVPSRYGQGEYCVNPDAGTGSTDSGTDAADAGTDTGTAAEAGGATEAGAGDAAHE